MRNRLRQFRTSKGWTQRELALRAKSTRAYIIGLEGGAPPSIAVAYRIARLFRRPVEDIFFPDWLRNLPDGIEPTGTKSSSRPDVPIGNDDSPQNPSLPEPIHDYDQQRKATI